MFSGLNFTEIISEMWGVINDLFNSFLPLIICAILVFGGLANFFINLFNPNNNNDDDDAL